MENRKILIAGATGLVGSCILRHLLEENSVSEVHLVSRRNLSVQYRKLTVHLVDFKVVQDLPQIDEVYLALGTTIKNAGSHEAFKAIDLEANLSVAKAAYFAGAKRIGLVSAMHARTDSMLFYNRIKGQLEDRLSGMPLESLVIARPSFLIGDREKLNQPQRISEKLGASIFKLLGPILPSNFRPVEASKVAMSLVTLVPKVDGIRIIESGEIQKFSPTTS